MALSATHAPWVASADWVGSVVAMATQAGFAHENGMRNRRWCPLPCSRAKRSKLLSGEPILRQGLVGKLSTCSFGMTLIAAWIIRMRHCRRPNSFADFHAVLVTDKATGGIHLIHRMGHNRRRTIERPAACPRQQVVLIRLTVLGSLRQVCVICCQIDGGLMQSLNATFPPAIDSPLTTIRFRIGVRPNRISSFTRPHGRRLKFWYRRPLTQSHGQPDQRQTDHSHQCQLHGTGRRRFIWILDGFEHWIG